MKCNFSIWPISSLKLKSWTNWIGQKVFYVFFKCQTFRMREKFRIGKFKNYIFLFLLNEYGIVSNVIVYQQEVKISNSKGQSIIWIHSFKIWYKNQNQNAINYILAADLLLRVNSRFICIQFACLNWFLYYYMGCNKFRRNYS